MAYYDGVRWPAEGVLMVMPYDPGLHGPASAARRGLCQWRDHEPPCPARWSVVSKEKRWAVCDEDLARFARAEFDLPSPGAGGPDAHP